MNLCYEISEHSLLTFYLTTIWLKDKKIWVRYGNLQAICFNQKELENKEIHYIHDLKGLIKDQMQSSLKDYSRDVICLYKGENILKSSTLIANLFNTENEALRVIIIGKNGMCNMTVFECFKSTP